MAMNKYRLSGVAVAAATAATTPMCSYAANFDFSFTGKNDTVVTGEIFGLAASGKSAATDIVVESGPVGAPLGFPLDVFPDFSVIAANTFTVHNGNIAGAQFIGQRDTPGLAVTLLINAKFLGRHFNAFDNSGATTENLGGFSAVTFTPAAVPEPASIALIGAGIAGISAFRRRRRAA